MDDHLSNNTLTDPRDISVMKNHIPDILETISKNPITNVVSLAGTGKTTELPLGIANLNNKITVVVSDSSVAESLSNYVGGLTGLKVGNSLSESDISDDITDDITYISQDDMKNHMYQTIGKRGCADLNFTDVLMIDEADRETLDQFMIMSLWRYCAESKYKIPRLLLVSSSEVQSSLFDPDEIEVYTIDTLMYPIEIRYSDKNYLTNSGDNNTLIYDVLDLVYEIHTSDVEGDILVFATEQEEVESIVDLLREMRLEDAEILPAHQNLSRSQIDRIYNNKEKGGRKIVIADKLAETTFTLKDLSVTIDMMREHRPTLTLTGGQRYPLRFITQHQANIRSSRGGRYRSLLCYRMIRKDLFDKLTPKLGPEIYRTPLSDVVLELLNHNIRPHEVLTMFSTEDIDKTIGLMRRLGVINTINKVTDIGRFVTKVPLGLRNAVCLWEWIDKVGSNKLGSSKVSAYPAIVLLSMIDSFGKSYFVYPFRDSELTHAEYNLELLEHRKRHYTPFEGESDVHTYSNIWSVMMDEVGGPYVPFTDIKEWCQDNAIQWENISEVLLLTDRIKKILDNNQGNNNQGENNEDENKEDENKEGEIGPFETDSLIELLGPIIAQVYSDREFHLSSGDSVRVRYSDNEGKEYKIDNQYSINTIERDTPETIWGLITTTFSSKYTSDFHTVPCSLVLS